MNERNKRQLRFLLLLPVIVVPFTTTLFWLLGGGSKEVSTKSQQSGLNTKLPGANISKDSAKDKLSFYEQAIADSLHKESVARNDPFYRESESKSPESKTEADERIKEIYKRNHVYQSYNEQKPQYEPVRGSPTSTVTQIVSAQEKDPEIEAINQTLEQLKSLQSTPQPKVNKTSIATNTVQAKQVDSDDDSFFGKKDSGRLNRFIDDRKEPSTGFSAIIAYTQIVQSGMPVKMQLERAMKCGTTIIPVGYELTGIAALEGDRMMITVSTVQVQGEIIPVSLVVHDLDGLEGIYVPGSLKSEVLKSTAEQSLQSVNILSLDPTVQSQLAAAGISAAKGLLSKKVKAVRTIITAGYKIILRNKKNE